MTQPAVRVLHFYVDVDTACSIKFRVLMDLYLPFHIQLGFEVLVLKNINKKH